MNPNQSERIGISMRITIRKNSINRKTGFSRLSLAIDKNQFAAAKNQITRVTTGNQLTWFFG